MPSKIDVETQVKQILEQGNIPRKSKKWKDYEDGKRLISKYAYTSDEYRRAIKIVSWWVGA